MPFSSELNQRDLELALRPYLLAETSIPDGMYAKFTTYLHLLLKWNARTNLTAIREPNEIVKRHFGESLFAAQHLGACTTLLDFGSGAGFPGLPIQLLFPQLQTTLAESQNKKATFLREVIRTLDLETTVWADRVEAMPVSRQFDVVTLRAVDNMGSAVKAAAPRAIEKIVLLTTVEAALPQLPDFTALDRLPLPGTRDQQLISLIRST